MTPARAVRPAVQPDHERGRAAATAPRSSGSPRWRSAPTPSSIGSTPTPAITPPCFTCRRATPAAAAALADTILAETPGHLFGYIVRGTAAQLTGDRRRAGAGRGATSPATTRPRAPGQARVPGSRAGDRRVPRQRGRAPMTHGPSTSRTAPTPTTRSCSTRSPRARSTPATCATSTSSADIETLNRRALRRELEVTAVSIHAYAHLWRDYALLALRVLHGRRLRAPAGGDASRAPADPRRALRGLRVAVPGLLTTAYLALKLYQPDFEAVVVPFDRIEDAVHAGRGGRRAPDPRGPAHLRRHRPPALGRSRRLVARGHRTPASARRATSSAGTWAPRSSRRSPGTCGPASSTPWSTARPPSPTPGSTTGASATSAPTPSSGCTSTSGRSTTARAGGRRCRRCWTAGYEAGIIPERVTVEFVG